MQASPLVFEMLECLCYLNRRVKKALHVTRMEGKMIIGTLTVVPSTHHEPARMSHSKGRCKQFRVEVCSPKIEYALKVISLHCSFLHRRFYSSIGDVQLACFRQASLSYCSSPISAHPQPSKTWQIPGASPREASGTRKIAPA